MYSKLIGIISLVMVLNIGFAQRIDTDTLLLEQKNICPSKEWKLVFHDEFDATTLDTSKWLTYYPQYPTENDQWEFGRTHGNEGQIYKDENVQLSDGVLQIIAKKENATWFTAKRNHTSGMIYTKPAYRFQYGKFVIRCKIPTTTGFWSAFWLWGGSEIDVFEFGSDDPDLLYTNIHQCYDKPNCHQSQRHAGRDYSRAFYNYSIEWTPDLLIWKVNGRVIRKLARYMGLNGKPATNCTLKAGKYTLNPLFPTDKMAVIANMAVGVNGGPFTDAPNKDSSLPNQFTIDFIRVYQKPSLQNMESIVR